MSEKELEQQVAQLHEILFHAESIQNICKTYEILDLNNYRVFRNPLTVRTMLRQQKFPFVFPVNRN